jgi:hypothetical protein
MASELDEALYWAGKASDAHHNVLETVQASAGKWQAAIAAFLGAYATVGFIVGPTTLASLPPTDGKYAIVAALGLAGIVGVIAVVLANRAAAGFPSVEQDFPLTGPQMAAAALQGAQNSRALLRRAILGAAIAGGLALLGSFGILATGLLTPAPAPYAVLVTHSGAYCGTLSTSNGAAFVRVAGGRRIPVAGGTITVVTACGGF